MSQALWPRVAQWVVALTLPLVLLATNVRIVTGPWFVRWEYGKEGFPVDPYGFSMEERTRLAEVCVRFLAQGADISLLEDLRLPSGARAFNERELSHMEDVQVVYNGLMVVGFAVALVLLGGSLALYAPERTRWRVPRAYAYGGGITLGLLVGVGLLMLFGWETFFTGFHRIFFEGDSWLFSYSDTLIRLFPPRFWMDVAIAIVGLIAVEAGLIGVAGWLSARGSMKRVRGGTDELS